MPPTKRASNDLTRPKKRVKSSTACGTVSQPIPVNSRLSSSPSRPSPRRALVETSQASTFESQLRESRPEDAIVAPTEGSERVTAASSAAALDNKTLQEALDASLIDDFEELIRAFTHALSKVHLSFDGWTTKGGKRGFLGVVAHFVDSRGDLQDLPIALPQLTGAHSGERIAEVVIKTLQDFKITSTVAILAQEYSFNATHRRLRCGPHTLNLIGQTLLWGKGSAALFDNDVQELTDEHDFIEEWRRVGPLGVLLSIINYIKTPQQHKLFEDF
ncbi:hypothetical protein L13192_02725 [Pyrenophora tritici-repentis]|nr:hypothetical protein L13192_02725 [Pyrenophora tritici-repentis]